MSFYRRQDRHLPVRPNLDQLKHQAKDLLRAIDRGDPEAVDEFKKFHPEASRFGKAKPCRNVRRRSRISRLTSHALRRFVSLRARVASLSSPNLLINESNCLFDPFHDGETEVTVKILSH